MAVETCREKIRLTKGLLQAAKEGDPNAFETIYTRFSPILTSAAARYVGPIWAADISQEVMIKAHAALSDPNTHFDHPATFIGWLNTVADNQARDFLRRYGSYGTRTVSLDNVDYEDPDTDTRPLIDTISDPKAPDPEDIILKREGIGELIDRIRLLDPDQQQAIELKILMGMKHREIAEQLGIPGGTVKSRVSRGSAALRNMYSSSYLSS